jgi:hypothetical protein
MGRGVIRDIAVLLRSYGACTAQEFFEEAVRRGFYICYAALKT